MLTQAAGHLRLAGIALLLADLLARAGRGPGRWSAAPKYWAVRWCLGLTAFGTALLGLTLVGLCFRLTVILLLPLLCLAARAGRPAASPVLAALGKIRMAWPAGIALALALLPVLAGLLSPHADHDSLIYHLGFPQQCLVVHKAPLDQVSLLFHFPLLSDLTHALPIALGDDRLGKWTSATALVAATAVAAKTIPGSGWLMLLLALTPRSLVWLAALTKNDVTAAALLVVGALLWRTGPRTTAALLFGASVAAKPVGAPLICIWVLCHANRNRMGQSVSSRIASALFLLFISALPLLPWLIKSWIATGDPAFPHGWRIFRNPFWTAANQDSLMLQAIWDLAAGHVATLPMAWLRSMVHDFPLQLIALPLLVLAGRGRSAVAAGAGAIALLFTGRIARYMIPAAWLVSIELGAAAAAIAGRRGTHLRVALALVSLALIGGRDETRHAPWAAFTERPDTARSAGLTGWADAAEDLGRRDAARVLTVGTDRIYPIPARVIYNGFLGETPLVWTMARESTDADRLRVKFRQLGTTILLHNFVSIEWMAMFQKPFPWDDRMLKVYAGFARGRMTPLDPPRRADREAGGYWTLALDTRPGIRAPESVFFLPGSEAAISNARRLRDLHDLAGAERELRKALTVTPGVLYLNSQLGQTLTDGGRWREAYDLFGPVTAAGFIDGTNLWAHGSAAIYAGRYDEAERLLLKSIGIYDTKDANRTNLAWCYQARADDLIRRSAGRGAEAWLAKSEATLADVPATPGTYWATPRRQIAALILGSRGDLLGLAGRKLEAEKNYAEAAALAPDLPEAKTWGALLK